MLSVFLPASAVALSLTPFRQTIVVDPGTEKVISLSVENTKTEPVTVVPEVIVFTIDETTGAALFEGQDEAAQWVVPESKQVTLGAKEKKNIFFTVRVPEGTEPAAHYLGLLIKEQTAEGQVALGARLSSLLFLYVSGEMHESLTRELFVSSRPVFTRSPAALSLVVKNTGTVHVIPQGEVVITAMFGREVEKISLNPSARKVLPQGSWRQEYTVGNLSWRDTGRITATMYMNYGLSTQQIVDITTFWFLPVVPLAGGIIIISLLVFIVLWRRKRI